MNTLRTIFRLFTSSIELETSARRLRIQRRPVSEQLEPRALLSALKVGMALPAAAGPAGGIVVSRINQVPSFKVTYQTDIVDQINVENDIVDQINVENDIVDQINVENDVTRGS